MKLAKIFVWPVIIAVAVVTLFFAVHVLRHRASEVVLVFPEGFRGTAKIRAHRPKGEALRPVSGTLVLAFPTSGILDISGDLPTLKWHVLRARFERGAPISVVSPDQNVSDDTIAVRSLGVTEGGAEDWYALGTAADAKRGLTEKWGFWPELGTKAK